MASDAYQVVDSYRTVETYGGLDSRDVQRVIVRAIPSSVAFGFHFSALQSTFADPALLADAIDEIARPYAGYVDAVINTPGVLGLYGYEDFNASLQQENRWVVTFGHDPGGPSVQRDIAFTDVLPDRFPAIAAAALASLDAILGAGGGT